MAIGEEGFEVVYSSSSEEVLSEGVALTTRYAEGLLGILGFRLGVGGLGGSRLGTGGALRFWGDVGATDFVSVT